MDFGELIHTAKQNGQAKARVQYYSTKFAPPKKEQRNKTLSVNIQKFLAKKEAEEKQRLEEANQKRDKLLALRAQDKKATRRVNVMLKRTKSANQSAIADALDEDNTAVTLGGPSQPDEDDYGYVSQESSALYNKMMEKYSKMPEEPKFNFEKRKVSTNLDSTKAKVKAALDREQEEAMMPRRRKKKHEYGDNADKSCALSTASPVYEEEKKEPPKPKFKPAPLVNFNDLLKLAEKKQFEPIVIEPKKVEEERLLTKKQKKEMEKEKEWRERRESQGRLPDGRPACKIPKLNGASPLDEVKITKKNGKESTKQLIPKPGPSTKFENSSKMVDKNANISKPERKIDGKSNGIVSQIKYNDKNQLAFKKPDIPRVDGSRSKQQFEKPRSDIRKLTSTRDGRSTNASHDRPKQNPALNERPKEFPPRDLQQKRPGGDFKSKFSNGKPKDFPPRDLKHKQSAPVDLKPKQSPAVSLKPKQFPPTDLKPKQFPPADVRRKELSLKSGSMKVNKRRILDDDEDDDSEMDDFIDDGPEGDQDYSQAIREIFGYDKRQYRYVNEDDADDMETTFAQQMREEVISTKIGIKEDLEDMKREEEEKKLKSMRKKGKF